ncbi:MAG TPA: GNAT family N-acetyltransferase [Thermoanaerobaculia bacterium]|nr:GNAT family N-acetyltransferase [Thermoanaerobaculia bacterium]HUM29769.1 GNAT family N-acetyltransferase [Thermoanaerobaculia bacterium]HXK67069.1 GNAT family N-acetyltransferase [Thermoanaerobaculia bacterium]
MSTPAAPRILILHNTPGESVGGCVESESGVMDQVHAVEEALNLLGIPFRILAVQDLTELTNLMAQAPEPRVINLVESLKGSAALAARVPDICEAFGKGCSGNSSLTLDLTLNKTWTKAVLFAAGLPVPRGITIPPGTSLPVSVNLPRGKLIVKPDCVDASEGLDGTSSIFNGSSDALWETVRNLHNRFGHPVIVEALVGSRELNVSVLQTDGHIEVLPLAEIDFSAFPRDKPRIVDYAAKWKSDSFEYNNTPRVIPAPLEEETANRIRALAMAAFRVTHCRDYARVDFRMGKNGELHILEVNANPDISPDAGFSAALAAAGQPYARFVQILLDNMRIRMEGFHEEPELKFTPTSSQVEPGTVSIRPTLNQDREAIVGLVRDTAFFRPEEVATAGEVVDEAVHNPEMGYISFTAEMDGRPVGWICYGATACTVGTWDIYWIAVDPSLQGRGVGKLLVRHAEEDIKRRNGRLAVIETSGLPLYAATQGFYLRLGYTEAARLKDFYNTGDDKIIYLKAL